MSETLSVEDVEGKVVIEQSKHFAPHCLDVIIQDEALQQKVIDKLLERRSIGHSQFNPERLTIPMTEKFNGRDLAAVLGKVGITISEADILTLEQVEKKANTIADIVAEGPKTPAERGGMVRGEG